MTDDDRVASAAHCWFKVDQVPGDPETTAWKRRARLRQARWREARELPIGAHPYEGGESATPVGSRLALAFATESEANLLGPASRSAARARVANPERCQMLYEDRLFADLLSSMPLCFNLFGDLDADAPTAERCVRAWWPDAPAGKVGVRFEHSPGRRDPAFLGNKSAFDVALEIDGGSIIGIETKYHEHAKEQVAPKPAAMARYVQVTEHSEVFVNGWRDRIVGTALQQIWLDHLLVLAMLQHPSGSWKWGRFVLVYPSENVSFARAAREYGFLLRDGRTFEARTLEDLLATSDALDPATAQALRDRYLGGP